MINFLIYQKICVKKLFWCAIKILWCVKKLIKLLKFSSKASQANKLKFHTQKWLNFCLKLQWDYLISTLLIQQVEFYPEISSLCELTQHDELFTDWVIIWKLLLPLYTFSSAHNDGVWENNKFLVLFWIEANFTHSCEITLCLIYCCVF